MLIREQCLTPIAPHFSILFMCSSLSLTHSLRGADFYPGVNSLGYGGKGKVSKAGIDRMVADLDQQ